MPTQDLQTLKLQKGPRTYFFDIAKSSQGLYLRMSCSEKGREGFGHHRIFVFEEDLSAFVHTLNTAAGEMGKLKQKRNSRAAASFKNM